MGIMLWERDAIGVPQWEVGVSQWGIGSVTVGVIVSVVDITVVVVVVLPNPFREMGAWRNSTETQQSVHAPRSGPEVKNGRSSAEDGALERIGCGTVKEEVRQIL